MSAFFGRALRVLVLGLCWFPLPAVALQIPGNPLAADGSNDGTSRAWLLAEQLYGIPYAESPWQLESKNLMGLELDGLSGSQVGEWLVLESFTTVDSAIGALKSNVYELFSPGFTSDNVVNLILLLNDGSYVTVAEGRSDSSPNVWLLVPLGGAIAGLGWWGRRRRVYRARLKASRARRASKRARRSLNPGFFSRSRS